MMDDSLAAAVTGKVALACDFGIPPHSWGTQIHVIYDSPRRPNVRYLHSDGVTHATRRHIAPGDYGHEKT